MSTPNTIENIPNLQGSDFTIKGSIVYVNNQRSPGMLLIWASYCHFCHDFIPTFQKISKKLNSKSSMFPCLAIENNQISTELSDALGVKGYPIIKFFDQSGKIIAEYNKPRNENAILQEICNIYHQCIISTQ